MSGPIAKELERAREILEEHITKDSEKWIIYLATSNTAGIEQGYYISIIQRVWHDTETGISGYVTGIEIAWDKENAARFETEREAEAETEKVKKAFREAQNPMSTLIVIQAIPYKTA